MDALAGIEAALVGWLGPLGPLIVMGGLGLAMIVGTLAVLIPWRRDPLDRLRGAAPGDGAPAPDRSLRAAGDRRLDRFASFLEPADAEEMSASRLKMLQAGYRGRHAVRSFHATQFGLALGLLAVGALSALVLGDGTPRHLLVLWMVGPAILGYLAPPYWVERRRQARQQEITEGFPDALDMMLVCVEAGQSLDQSILRVAREMERGYPALAEEFETVAREVKAGKERIAVLKDMSERCGVVDVQSFVTVLVQSATFGTSIADALRVFAGEMRDKRVMRAEEKANVLPTKLTLGTMLLTVPPLLIILVGPSVVGIVRALGSF